MKFKLMEDMYEEDDRIYYTDLDYSEEGVLREVYSQNEELFKKDKQNWIKYIYPELPEKVKLEITNVYEMTPEEFGNDLDKYDLADDMIRYGWYSQENIQDLFEEYFQDEIQDYIDTPSYEEVTDEWNRDYYRSRF